MNKFFLTAATAFFAFAFLFSTAGSASAQLNSDVFAQERRPFDFSDRYYESNGIIPSALVDRRNGADGQSVFDINNDRNHTSVRITATMPAYDGFGGIHFWNYYAGFDRSAFSNDSAGGNAVTAAYNYPLYVFPSTTVKNADRQAAILRIDGAYAEKNPLGVAAVMIVEFTDRIFTRSGQLTMNMLAQKNGVSVDGTPIIKTAKELEGLTADGLITQRQAYNSERMPFAIAKVIQSPELGAIAPDAYLVYVKEKNGQPLAAEKNFISYFECLQAGSGQCF